MPMTEERLKHWLGFWKFFLGTVALGLASTIINANIQNREIEVNRELQRKEIELKETSEENKHLSNFISFALDKDLTKRRDFAKYFAIVSRSEAAQKRWATYVTFIEDEIEQNLKTQDEKVTAELAQLSEIEQLTSELYEVRKDATAEEHDVDALRSSLDVAQIELYTTQLDLEQLRSEIRRTLQATPASQFFPRADLVTEDALVREADLRGRSITNVSRFSFDLTEIDLAGAILESVNLRDSTLVGANFEGAVLQDVDLRRGNLFKSSFRNATFALMVDLQGANLREADFTGAVFISGEVRIEAADLRGAIGLTCQQLTQAFKWETAFRDDGLACGESIPMTK